MYKINTCGILGDRFSQNEKKKASKHEMVAVQLASPAHSNSQTHSSYTTLNVRGLKIEQLSRDPAFEA